MTVGEKVKQIRKEKGLTQKALGELLSISEGMVRQYELGIRNPKIETIEKIASALKISPFEIMGYSYWDEKYNPDGKLAEEVKVIQQVEKEFGQDAFILLQYYSKLNEKGQKKAINDLADMTEIEKYKKIVTC